MKKKISAILFLILLAVAAVTGCGKALPGTVTETDKATVMQSQTVLTDTEEETADITYTAPETRAETEEQNSIDENGTYTSKDDVALYIHTYGHLPDNYITKSEAEALGRVSSKGNLAEAAPGKSIGGDKFGNREGLLPDKSGRKYYECDIDYVSGTRNAKRIIFSNDGLVYYTEDHYESFEKLYGEE